MIDPGLIPTADPSSLPAPYWIFKLLLNLTFILHLVAMNLLVGSGFLALWARFKSGQNEYPQMLFREIVHLLPIFLPATITLGVAPLLFVQVLYGPFFYSSSIIMGWPWFLVLVCLTLLYYGFYFASFRKWRDLSKAGWVVSISLMLVLIIGFIYTNNVMLSMTPERWHPKYLSDASGWNLNLGEPTLIPRFLHFLLAALAVGGLLLALRGIFNQCHDVEYSRYLIQLGGKTFIYATMAQFAAGIWFFVLLPRAQRLLFMGDSAFATVTLMLGIFSAIAALMLVSGALRRQEPNSGIFAGMACAAIAIILMAISRDALRDSYLQPYLHPMSVQTQWGVFPLFLAIFLSGLVLWLIMMKRYQFFRKGAGEQPVSTRDSMQ